MTTLTESDFAAVPWGGMAMHEDGRKAVRIPGDDEATTPWYYPMDWDQLWDVAWHSDADMAAEPGWRIVETVTLKHHEAVCARWTKIADRKQAHIWDLQDHLSRRNRQIEKLTADLDTAQRQAVPPGGRLVTTAREALETLTDEDWVKVAVAAEDWAWRFEAGEWVPTIADVLLAAVTPAPVPEPWETAPYVIVTHENGDLAVMKNTGDGCRDHHGGYWTRSQIASMNPRPFDPTEVE